LFSTSRHHNPLNLLYSINGTIVCLYINQILSDTLRGHRRFPRPPTELVGARGGRGGLHRRARDRDDEERPHHRRLPHHQVPRVVARQQHRHHLRRDAARPEREGRHLREQRRSHAEGRKDRSPAHRQCIDAKDRNHFRRFVVDHFFDSFDRFRRLSGLQTTKEEV
jgi:hypothetical protein